MVDPGNGEPARLYGTTDPVVVPTLTREPATATASWSAPPGRSTCDRHRRRRGRAGGVRRRVAASRSASPRRSRRRSGAPGTATSRRSPPPTSLRTSRAFDEHELAVDVVQIDDGWSPGLGEGLEPPSGSGRCPAVVDAIRSGGRRAGHLAGAVPGRARETSLAREHPDWLVGPGRPQLGPGARRPGPDPPRRSATCCADALAAAGRARRRLPQAGLPLRGGPAARDERRGLPLRAGAGPRGGRAGRLPRRLRSTAAARASGWSTRCGSRPTPSTRAARTAPRGCAG